MSPGGCLLFLGHHTICSLRYIFVCRVHIWTVEGVGEIGESASPLTREGFEFAYSHNGQVVIVLPVVVLDVGWFCDADVMKLEFLGTALPNVDRCQ